MENFYDRHFSSRSSSGKRLCEEFTFFQKSVWANIETISQSDGKVDQRWEKSKNNFVYLYNEEGSMKSLKRISHVIVHTKII